jgi:hypothetical protein
MHYLLPLVFDRVNDVTYKALQRLVLSMSLATSFEIRHEEIKEVKRHLMWFIKWFYDTYYQRSYERLPSCKYTIHGMLHLVEGLINWGPASYYWQYAEVSHQPSSCLIM